MRAGQRHALLLAAGELGGAAVGEMAHLHQVERALDVGLDVGRALLPHAQAVGDVVEHRHVRPHGVGLEHHRHAALLGRHVLARRRRRTSPGRRCGSSRRSAAPGRRWRASVVVLPQPEGPSRVTCSPRPTVKLTPFTATCVAVAHDQILHFDARRAHCSSLVMPRVTRNRIISAMITVKVWISAIAAVSSVPLVAKASTIDGRDHLGVGAHQESRGAELAHAGHEDQQPRRQDAGLEQRQGDGAHLVAPRGAADARAFLEALVDLQHHAGQGAHAERQHDGEIGERQQPQRAVDADRDVEPGPQQREAEHQARHGLREHHQIFDGAAAPELRAVDDPDQQRHDHHAHRGDAEAQHDAVAQRGAHRAERQRELVVGEGPLRLAQDHGGEALQRGHEQRRDREDHRQHDVEGADAEQHPGHAAHVHRPRPERLAGDGGEAAAAR